MLPLLLALFVQQAELPAFAPPIDAPLRILSERDQQGETGEFHFRLERLIRFSPDGIGYRAEVRIVAATATGKGDTAILFGAGFTGLIGKPIVVRLDAAGKVIAIDDQPAVWKQLCDNIEHVITMGNKDDPAQRELILRRVAAPMRALPADRQLAMLGSLADAAIAHDSGEPDGERSVRLPAASPFGGVLMLAGTSAVSRAGSHVHIDTRAQGDASVDAIRDTPARTGHVETAIVRDYDSRTGMVSESSETVTTRLDARSAATRTTRTHIDAATPAAWEAARSD